MTSLAAKIRKWLGLEKKPVDAPKHGAGAPEGAHSARIGSSSPAPTRLGILPAPGRERRRAVRASREAFPNDRRRHRARGQVRVVD